MMDEIKWVWTVLKFVNGFDGFFADMLGAFVPVFVGVWLSLKVALRKFTTEKWWEEKAAAYEAIIEAEYHAFRFYDEALNELSNDVDVDQEKQDELDRNSKDAHKEIVRVMTIGTLKVSQDFLDRLKQLREDESAASETNNWNEHVLKSYEAHRSCLDDLVRLAKKDLSIDTK